MLFNEKKKKLSPTEFQKEIDRLVAWVKESVSPFENDTPEKKEVRVSSAKGDQDFFNHTYMPHYFREDSPDFHREMEAMEEEAERQQRPDAAAAPRGFAKTTRALAKRLKRGLYKEKRFVVIIGADETLAAGNTVAIRVEAEHNPRIVHDFGKQKTSDWAEGDFVLKGGTRYWARGVGQRIRGELHGAYRPDDILIDDPETDEMVRNGERVKNLLAYVREAVFPSLEPRVGLLTWRGTLLSKRSALAQILGDPAWITRTFRAVEDPVWDEEAQDFTSGVSLWPARFPLAELGRIRRIVKSAAFNKEYQNDPRDDEAMFQEKWVRRIKWNALPNVPFYPYAGRDPSAKAGQSNDFKAFVLVARGGANYYCTYASIKKISRSKMVQEDYALFDRFHYLQLGLEAEGLQELFRDLYAFAAIEKKFHLPIVPVLRKGISKEDESRIGGLSPQVEGGHLIFCEGPPSEVGDMELLLDQLYSFPSSTVHDDGPDGLETAYHLAEKRAMSKPSYERVAKREAQFGVGAW